MASGNSKILGFTLIELSIVLVIIGLIVGGILTGRDLIETAAQRAQIAQIEKYGTAIRTFQLKYGYLPGDIPDPYASNFGFSARGTGVPGGEGDGNGILQGYVAADGVTGAAAEAVGETAIFWADLSTAGLVDVNIQSYDAKGAGYPSAYHINSQAITLSSSPGLYQWLPTAKLGNGNFVYVWSNASSASVANTYKNYFAVSTITDFFNNHDYETTVNPGVTVTQAYNIDKKTDDGVPLAGNVTACYVNWNSGYHGYGIPPAGLSLGQTGANAGWANGSRCNAFTTAVTYDPANCYDNGGVAGKAQAYSVAQNASSTNCALSFGLQ
ncbi:MAG TPA: prepilin-type N-terminal cleavage/methylation domain-containing protein [Rickettsiales bacterium]|nr:prepilin-type N-terminal cleavage/methylation domain-containing protein [Rickettsiales bacterium]